MAKIFFLLSMAAGVAIGITMYSVNTNGDSLLLCIIAGLIFSSAIGAVLFSIIWPIKKYKTVRAAQAAAKEEKAAAEWAALSDEERLDRNISFLRKELTDTYRHLADAEKMGDNRRVATCKSPSGRSLKDYIAFGASSGSPPAAGTPTHYT